jgi:diaminobutyrate-2-oxoglutarate transaminase
MQGIDCGSGELAGRICARAFQEGLVIEKSGSGDQVVKYLSPLTISESDMASGLDILNTCAVNEVLAMTADRTEFAGVTA